MFYSFKDNLSVTFLARVGTTRGDVLVNDRPYIEHRIKIYIHSYKHEWIFMQVCMRSIYSHIFCIILASVST